MKFLQNRMRGLIVTLGLSLTLFFQACGPKTTLLVVGSSTVYPITEGIAEEYRFVDSSINVVVGISGTGGGFKKFCIGETDISDASRPIKSKEAEVCVENKVEYLEMPVAYDGLAVVINKDNFFVKSLTVEQLKKIFQAENPAQTWNEVDPKFPNEKIEIYAPGQDSGTYDYFSETILGKDVKMRGDAVFSEDDNVLVTGVAGSKNAIGFFGLAYYEENKDSLNLVSVVNPKTGKTVAPTLDTVKSGEYSPLSRPIFIYASKSGLEKKGYVEFITFYLENAAKISKDVGYIPLPSESYEKSKKSFSAFK